MQYWSCFRKRCCCTLAQTDWSWMEPEASCRRFNGISQIQKWYSNDFQCRWIGSIIKEIRISSSYLYNYILVLILTNLVLSIIWSRIIRRIRLALFCYPPCKFFALKFNRAAQKMNLFHKRGFVNHTRCLSVLDFWKVNLGVYYKLEKKSISEQTWFFVKFELDFYCLCSLQKSISKSNWFFDFLNLIFRNWKKNRVTLDISKIKWR